MFISNIYEESSEKESKSWREKVGDWKDKRAEKKSKKNATLEYRRPRIQSRKHGKAGPVITL